LSDFQFFTDVQESYYFQKDMSFHRAMKMLARSFRGKPSWWPSLVLQLQYSTK